MDISKNKCVIILDENMPSGVSCNTSTILGASLGKELPEIVGENIIDGNNNEHYGVVQIPITILKTNKENLIDIRKSLFEKEDIFIIDFNDTAKNSLTYDDYKGKII